jgi:protein TonB
VQPATRAPAVARLQSPVHARPQTHVATSAPRRDATGERPQEAARKDIATNGGEPGEHSVKPAESAASAPSTTASGVTQARLLSQPLPVLPDDLREMAYRAEALARFAVHPDGTFDIRLVTPTQNPRLNQILLETLRKWRFFPAMDNGYPVESHQDVRIHFNVE